MTLRDVCQLCRKGEAKWVALSDREHTYWHLYLTRRLKPDFHRTTQLDPFLVCEQCKRFMDRVNSRSKWPRRLVFHPWS